MSSHGGCCGGGRRERAETSQPKVTSQPRKAGTEAEIAHSSQCEEAGKGKPATGSEPRSSDVGSGSGCGCGSR